MTSLEYLQPSPKNHPHSLHPSPIPQAQPLQQQPYQHQTEQYSPLNPPILTAGSENMNTGAPYGSFGSHVYLNENTPQPQPTETPASLQDIPFDASFSASTAGSSSSGNLSFSTSYPQLSPNDSAAFFDFQQQHLNPPLSASSSGFLSQSQSSYMLASPRGSLSSMSTSMTESDGRSQMTDQTMDDDRTPVVLQDQKPIPPSSLPSAIHSRQTTADSSDHSRHFTGDTNLMSPFKAYHGQRPPHQESPSGPLVGPDANALYMVPQHHHQHPQQTPEQYHHQVQPHTVPGAMPHGYTFPTAHSYVPSYFTPANQPPPHEFSPYQHMLNPYQPQYYAYPEYAQPGSKDPSSSSSSLALNTLTRTGTLEADPKTARPKVKLSKEDKKAIVELHRSDRTLRQEDIAKQYGVDRSTISKIILASDRWTAPELPPDPAPVVKPHKTVGGRFPVVEQELMIWWDEQVALGIDVRDSVAREKAKEIAGTIGFPVDRFKGSAKWLDKFKERRKQLGKPITSSMPYHGYYYNQPHVYPMASPMSGPVMLSRSQSAATLCSSDSSTQEILQPSPIPVDRLVMAKSESDLAQMEQTPISRQRSQSSPQQFKEFPGMTQQTPAFGKAVRPSPLALQRQNSYHGTSPSPRRPQTISRANSSQSIMRRSKPGSLAASAFGITPLGGDESPMSPATSGSASGTHSRARSDISLTPFTTAIGSMTLSPDGTTPGDMTSSSSIVGVLPLPLSIPPLSPMTPITPGTGAQTAMVPQTDYSGINDTYHHHQQHHQTQPSQHPQHAHHQQNHHYATMPPKHYQYGNYQPNTPATDFGPAYQHQMASQPQWS